MASTHFTTEQLTKRFDFPQTFKNVVFGLIGVGIVLIVLGGFLAKNSDGKHDDAADDHAMVDESTVHTVADPHGEEDEAHGHHEPTWITRMVSGFLMHSLYFLTVAMGALFFIAVHRVGNAGWQTGIRRVPEAMFGWLPFAAVCFGVMLLLADQVYEWLILHEGVDALIDEKRAYLNMGFFTVRTFLFIGVWLIVAIALRRLSVKEDENGGLEQFRKSEGISAFFLVFFAISYTLFSVDWIKSLEPHWFSTIFGAYVFAGSMASAMALTSIIVYVLHKNGYMPWVNKTHFEDINVYVLGFSIFWAYMWISQYLLIWYSNIPEEGIYYVKRYRVDDHAYLGYAFSFYANLFLNFVIPFLALIAKKQRRNPQMFIPICVIVLIGHWNDMFQLVMPGAMGSHGTVGMVEIGFFLFFLGSFLYVVFDRLTKANLIPINHPYLEETLHHDSGPV